MVSGLKAELQLIIGPVFSGKTTELYRRVERYKLAGHVCALLKFPHKHETASGCSLKIDKNRISIVTKVWDALPMLDDVQVVAIDDGHYFRDVANSDFLVNCGKVVIIAALDCDFSGKCSKAVVDLFPLTDSVCKLSAVCVGCGADASFSKMDSAAENKEYIAVCRRCYFSLPERIESGIRQTIGIGRKYSNFVGQIQIIFGPMFSGKTTEMLRRRNRHALASRLCKVVKYAGDTRYDVDKVATHDRLMQEAINANQLSDVFEKLLNYEVILIDEGQFFPDIIKYSKMLANCGKIVIISSLDGDFRRKSFDNQVLELCGAAESVVKLKAVCTECGNDAPFTHRITSEKKQEVIGGKDIYRALCRACYLNFHWRQIVPI